ncbi:MAG: hypothetical protein OM95_01655 [Bdellovibrio sp. ArHS]|uniref:hypothetical protein n=1 Tax=Bdellovibrio sp. ArHS TaxID=1569284 RepID=UPI000583F242|nr:hypothetical protein [Bdellovibrio sp. ArHS]KHD89800.1 MAG: hypothetical protein OM95_01655 [Bdellovibrio sp. ArHS]
MKYVAIGLLLLASQVSFAGPRVVKNGGDMDAIEFVGIGQQLVKTLGEHRGLLKFDLNTLAKAVDETRVESTTKKLTLDGMDKDAINTPSAKRIVFNRIAWAGKGDLDKKAILVLHEYFGIAGVADQKYDLSTSTIEKVGFGKVNYRGEIFDRKLSKEEVSKLLPIYLNMITSQVSRLPSPQDNRLLKLVKATAMGFTRPVSYDREGSAIVDVQETISILENYTKELKETTAADRQQSTMDVVNGFRSSTAKVSCELGYKSVTRDERIVRCVDNQSSDGYMDERTIILSVDEKTLEPMGVLLVDSFQAD